MPPLPAPVEGCWPRYLAALERWRRRPFDWAEDPDLFRSPQQEGGARGR